MLRAAPVPVYLFARGAKGGGSRQLAPNCTRDLTRPVLCHTALVQTANFTGAVMEECHHGYLRYRLPQTNMLTLSFMFEQLESAKEGLRLEDYCVSQTSLDEVFCSFANEQDSDRLENRGTSEGVGSGGESAALPATSAVFSANGSQSLEPVLPRQGLDDDDADNDSGYLVVRSV